MCANYLTAASAIQKQLSRFSRGLQTQSDHLLILGGAVLFGMYLLLLPLSNTTQDSTARARKMPQPHSRKKEALQHKLLYRSQWYVLPLAFGILIHTLDLMRKHLSLSVKQQAILGTLPIVDSSRAGEPVVL